MANRLPVFATQLVEELDKSHPARCMKPGESLEEHLRYAGARYLIDALMLRLKVSVESDPTRPVVK